MSKIKELYRKFIRKACGSIVYEVEQCQQKNSELEKRTRQLEGDLSELGKRVVRLEENIRKNNGRLNELTHMHAGNAERIQKLEENIRQNNGRLNGLERSVSETRIIHLEENIRKNNLRLNELEKADSKMEMNLVKLKSSMGKSTASAAPVTGTGLPSEAGTAGTNAYSKIDYFDFENHFRGSVQNVKDRQKMYLPYFENCSQVLDIGCGRGEFLELLKENSIPAKGIDLYDEYAEYCSMKDLDVVCGDAIEYLAVCETMDGIMAAQLVEHLETNQIVTLCERAYEKLREGGVLIMETPNPKALSIYVNEFYMDPSHVKPVHPKTLKYLAEKAGFSKVEIIYTEGSRVPKSIPVLKLAAEGNLEEFNSGMQEVSELLYGSRDYAVIARK